MFSHPFRSPIWITELLIEPAIMQLDYDIAVSGKVSTSKSTYLDLDKCSPFSQTMTVSNVNSYGATGLFFYALDDEPPFKISDDTLDGSAVSDYTFNFVMPGEYTFTSKR